MSKCCQFCDYEKLHAKHKSLLEQVEKVETIAKDLFGLIHGSTNPSGEPVYGKCLEAWANFEKWKKENLSE